MLVLLAAAFLRFYRIDHVPPGLHFDEAAYIIDSLGISAAWHPIFFPNNNGREPFWLYWERPFLGLLGPNVHSARLAAAFLGMLTVPATGLCASQLFWRALGPGRARLLGLASGAVLSGLYWHVNFSRIGLRTISLPLMAALCFAFLWRGLRSGRPRHFALAGLWGGLSVYTYIAARVIPVIVALWRVTGGRRPIVPSTRHPSPTTRHPLLITAVVWLVVAAPIAIYWARHPNEFGGRSEGVSIFNPAVSHGAPWRMALENLGKTLLMFNLRGSLNGAHNLPGRPVFDPLMGLFFLLGVGLCLARPRPAQLFTLLWLLCALPATILSVDAPYFLRLTLAIPPTAILAGIGLEAAAAWLPPRGALAVIALPSLLSAGLTWDAYFRQWAPSEAAYGYMMEDKVQASRYLAAWVARERVFLAPLYRRDYTFELLTRDLPIRTFDAFRCTVLPAPGGDDVRYVFPPFDQGQPHALRAHLPAAAREEDVNDSRGQLLLRTLVVPGSALPPLASASLAVLSDEVALVTARAGLGPPIAPGTDLPVAIEWQALRPPMADYTVALHLLDSQRRLVAQRDERPCGGAFPTTAWQPGDRLRDQYLVPVGATVPPGAYRLVATLYTLPSLRTLPVVHGPGSGGAEVDLGAIAVKREGG